MALLASVALFAALAASPSKELEKFVNRDLSKLRGNESIEFERACKQIPGYEHGFTFTDPRWIKPFRVGAISWLFVKTYQGYMHPSASSVEAFAFDENWRLVRKYSFLTGWRLWLDIAKISEDRWFGEPLLEVNVRSESPLILVWGGPFSESKTTKEQRMRQSYVLTEEGPFLVGLRTVSGEVVQNYYVAPNHQIGPVTTGRTAKQWSADLFSANPARQLSCMIWLAGAHIPSKRWHIVNYYKEPLRDCKTYEAMRSDKVVLKRIADLSKTHNLWLQEQAAFTLARLAEPQPEPFK